MANILIVYSTTDGHTLRICQRLQQVIEQQNHRAKLVPVDEVQEEHLALSDKIVIGASVRHGKHRQQVYDFIKRNMHVLESKPGAFFSVNVVARKPDKNRPDTNPYMKQFKKKSSWKPDALAVFAGKIDYQKYGFLDRHVIRLIMWLTKGPTHPNTVADFTDWKEVEAFGRRVCTMQ